VHLEENKEFRESVHAVVAQIPEVRYLNTIDTQERTKTRTLLAVNLLNRVHDPLASIAACVKASPDHQDVFAYCADGNFGFAFGDVTFLTHPVDSDACVAWLMESCGAIQRLLLVSNNIEMSSGLRPALTRIRCSTSVALDLRQVTDLLPMIQPEAVLVDLSLPRAEGLRLISRLRADAKTESLPIGVLLPDPQKMAEFRQYAARAAREGSIGAQSVAANLATQLGLPLTGAAAGGGLTLTQNG
jgi:CheY-like chemotaxis protein